MTKKLNILVIDDNPVHQEAARLQLGGEHNLTVVGTYDEAQELLGHDHPYQKARERQAAVGRKDDQAFEAQLLNELAVFPEQFDVVLTDLLMPASGWIERLQGQNSPHRGKEMPIGIFIGLLAARGGAKVVAVFTDSNHHAHPGSACFDAFNPGGESYPCGFPVGGCRMFLCNGRNFVDTCDPQDIAKPLSYEAYKGRTDTVPVKNWKKLLDYVLNNE